MKEKKIITITATSLAAIMVILSGLMKIIKNEEVVSKMNAVGVGKYVTILGIMEIAFITIFLFPKTMKLGFILLSCYFSGALATDLSHGGNIIAPVLLLVLVWASAYLRDSSIFESSFKVAANKAQM